MKKLHFVIRVQKTWPGMLAPVLSWAYVGEQAVAKIEYLPSGFRKVTMNEFLERFFLPTQVIELKKAIELQVTTEDVTARLSS